jgi:hypothetical protein
LAVLYADLSANRRRLSSVVADHRSIRADAPTRGSARVRLAHAVLVDGCGALDRVTELPALAREQISLSHHVGADLVAQADAVASAAARLAVVLRGQGIGFRGDQDEFRGDVDAPPGLAGLMGLGPNETDESLILAAENISLALSLAARLVLVLARLRARTCRGRRLAMVFPGRPAARWAVRVASLPLASHLAHVGPTVPPHPAAVVVAAVLAALVASVGRQVLLRLVGPVGAVVGLLGELVGAVVSVALPHVVLLVLAFVDVLTATPAVGRTHRPAACREQGRLGVTSRHRRPRRVRREPRDR